VISHSLATLRRVDFGIALLGLLSLDGQDLITKALVHALIPKIEQSVDRFDEKDLYVSMFALQNLDSSKLDLSGIRHR
jgi:hypothetical protein